MNQDEILQLYLHQIETGKPLSQVLADLPAEHRDLGELISIAAQTRVTAHPIMRPTAVASQRERVTASARSRQNTVPARRRTWKPAAIGIAAFSGVAIFAVVVFAALVFLVSTANAARSATLADVSGIVEAASSPDLANWTILNNGDTVTQGMHLRTRADSSATLVFFDGTRANVSAQSDLALTHIGGTWNPLSGKGLQVRLQQLGGETSHTVVPLQGSSSFYEVLTPSGTAIVHGTIFDVSVDPAGTARFAVSRGKVEVSQSDNSVFLTAGQATVSQPQTTLLPPTYEFFIQGIISAISGTQWTVNGIAFNVDPAMASHLSFQVGDWVKVRGRILTDGTYTADWIESAIQALTVERFTGVVESIASASWTISGKTVIVNAQTDIGSNIAVHDPVRVTFIAQSDGSWLASRIDKLDAEKDDEHFVTRTPAPSRTVDPLLTPQATRTREAENEDEHNKTEEPRRTRTPEGTVQPTLTGTILPTESVTPVVTQTPQPTETGEGSRMGCNAGDSENHEGQKLASHWGVPYAEIMSWFCRGFGFGEIDLAYELAKDSGKPVAEIFALKSGGQGWGLIKQQLKKNGPPPASATLQTQITVTPGQGGGDNTKPGNNGNGNGKDKKNHP